MIVGVWLDQEQLSFNSLQGDRLKEFIMLVDLPRTWKNLRILLEGFGELDELKLEIEELEPW